MEYDDGEVLPGLNENWTFMGATLVEWIAGFSTFLMVSIFAPPGRVGVAVPFMIVGWVGTTYTLATIRQCYPDEQRGVRNSLMSACGFEPYDIPAPAMLQPVWSGAPIREVDPNSPFKEVGLDIMFPSFQYDLKDADESEGKIGSNEEG